MDTTRSSLLVRLKDPADQAARTIYHEVYGPLIHGYVLSLHVATQDADDVVQSAHVKLLQHIRDYEHSGSFKAYLWTIVHNLVRDARRRRGEKQLGSDEWTAHSDPHAGPPAEFEERWIEVHLRFCLERVRSRVHPRTYRAFQAVALERRPVIEVAAELGLKANDVHQRKFRVLRHVQRLLRDLFEIELDLAAAR